MLRNVASQKLTVFAWDSTTGLPQTGDAANLTAYVDKDDGGVTVLGDTSATEKDSTNAKGYYIFDLTQSETNADKLLFTAKSSTANIVVIGVPAVVQTVPQYLSSQSIDTNGRVDVIKVAGTTQTARDLGASVLLSSGTGTGQVSLSAGKVAATLASTDVTGNVAADLQTIKTQTVTCAGGVTVPAATLASTTNITAGTITTVTTLTNDPQSIRANTAQAGGATTITLDASASATNDLYVGNEIVITGGTGAGQTRRITDYVGSTKVATVDSAWVTNPDNTSTFKILPLAAVDVDTAAIAADVSSSIGTSGITITSPLINGVVTLYANRDYTTGTGRLEFTKPDDVDWPTSLGSGGYETIEFHAKIGVPGSQTTDKVGTGSVVTPTAPNQEVAFVFTREAINTLNESFLDAIDGTSLIASLAMAKQNGGELSSSVAAQLEQRSSYTVMAFTSPGCEGTILAQGPLNIVDAGFDSSGSTCPLTP